MVSAFPLLITATFEVGDICGLALLDPRERVLRHMEALLAWFRDSCFDEIVLVKNCSLPICVDPLHQTADAHGKRFEFLQVESSPLTRERGKGYGEGDMIRKALKESELLKRSDGFCKATGKLYLKDAAAFYGMAGSAVFFQTPAPQCGVLLFWRRLLDGFYQSDRFHRVPPWLHRRARIPWSICAAAPTKWLDTRFYRVSKEVYAKRFSCSHERVDDALGYSLEAALAADSKGLHGGIFMEAKPIVFGYSGTHGTAAAEFPQDIRDDAADLVPKLLQGF